MRKLILNLHLYVALVAGLFLVVIALTGSIIAFEPELDRTLNPSLFNVEPGPNPLPVADVLGALKTAYPDRPVAMLWLPSSPDMAYSAPVRGSEVFVNGYTGKIIGARSTPTILGQIHQLHLRLLMPKAIGTSIVAICAVVLVWLVISGVYLWWRLKRITVKMSGSSRRIAFDLHNAAGISFAAFLLVLALTGIFAHFDDASMARLNKSANVADPPSRLPSTVQKGVKPISADQAIQIAKDLLPGTTPRILFVTAGPKDSYRVFSHFPEDLTGTRSWAIVDQYSGKPLFVESSRSAAPGNRILDRNRAIHTGQIFGLPTRILMCLSSLMLVVQVVTGYIMWWKKLRGGKAAPGVA